MAGKYRGRVWKFGDNLSGDDGILDFSAVRDHSQVFDAKTLSKICFATINPKFQEEVKQGDIVVGGASFAKPAHDQVVVGIQAAGIEAILCESCEARFVRKGFNIGIPIIVCPGITDLVEQDQTLEVDLAVGLVTNVDTGMTLQTNACPDRLLEMLELGGVIPYLAQHFDRRDGNKDSPPRALE